MDLIITTLKNGKKVGNFSSPHSFIFDDGTVLDPVTPIKSKELEMHMTFTEPNERGDVEIHFALTEAIIKETSKWIEMQYTKRVDVVFIPLPMLMELRRQYDHIYKIWPFRSVVMTDRIHKIVSSSKQAI